MQTCLRGLCGASLVGALAIACSAQLHGKANGGSGASTGAGATGATAGLGAGGTGLVTGSGGSGAVPGPGPVTLPDGTVVYPMYQRIRRLTDAEYENSVHAVVNNPQPVSSGFAPDSRQQGFTVNDAQQVDSVFAKQVSAAADVLAAQVVAQLDTFAPCADPTTQADQCATTFIQTFGKKAYRRPVEDDEVSELLTLFHSGTSVGTYSDGISQLARGILQAASFLYVTEIGDPTTAAGQAIKLTPYEIASELSYMLTASPPDDSLIAAAESGQLDDGPGRVSVANRSLLNETAALDRVTRIVREWLGTDRLEDTDKDSNVYPNYTALKPAMVKETTDFIWNLVQAGHTGTVGELLDADWTSVTDANLATMYGGSGTGVIQLPTRRGILNQGAFLSVFAHASETAPVLRGVAVMRRVACITVKSPTELNIQIVPPLPNPHVTNRQRYATHATDMLCASCHDAIDSFGFSFEEFDGMGQSQTTDNDMNIPIDSSVTISVGSDFDGSYPDSNALAVALGKSANVRECFARQVFRASSGRSDSGAASSEDSFVEYWTNQEKAASVQGNIVNALLDYAANPAFIYRSPQQ